MIDSLLRKKLNADAGKGRGLAEFLLSLHTQAPTSDSLIENCASGKRRISMKMYEEALALSRQNKDRTATIILLDNLATRYAATGDTESGLRLEREAISLMKPSDHAAMSNSYNNLAEMETSSRN